MTDLNPLQTASLFILTVSYFTCYRGTLKSVTIWGAFEFGNQTGKWKFPLSLILLVFVPIVIYALELEIVTVLALKIFNHSDNSLLIIAQISLVCIIILLLSLFPLATKHLWCLIAQCVEKKQWGVGWFNSEFNRTKLRPPIYSWQVIVLNGLIPFALSLTIIRFCGMPKFSGLNLMSKIYLLLYVSQFIVLYAISKEREYFHHERHLIISWRMLGTLTATIVFPIIVGVAIFPLYIRFLGETNIVLKWIFIAVILAFLPFPYYMNQSLMPLGKKKGWEPNRSEYQEGRPWWWRTCTVAAVSCVFLWFVLYCFKVIDLNLMLDVAQKLKL